MRAESLAHEFVESAPAKLEPGKLYVSIPYASALHLCCCGCGNEVVTPLSRTGWTLTFDGESVSLHPSIGNWGLQCQSHYWIKQNKVRWSSPWSREEIEAGRGEDRRARRIYLDAKAVTEVASPRVVGPTAIVRPKKQRANWFKRLWSWLRT